MRIGITGPVADKNLGDYGMLVNNIYDMGKNNDYFVFSYNPKFSKWVKDEYLTDFRVKIIPIRINTNKSTNINNSAGSGEHLVTIKEMIKRFICSFFNIESTEKDEIYHFTSLEIIRKIKDIQDIMDLVSSLDLLIVNGGGYFNKLWYTWGRKNDFLSIVSPLIIANYLEKRIIFTSNSFGPFGSTLPFFKQLFCELKHVHFGIRDKLLSKANLISFGIPREKITWIPDDLFFLNKRLSVETDPIPFENYLVLEIYQPIDKIVEEIKELINFAYKNYGLRTVFIFLAKGGNGEINSLKLKKDLNNNMFYVYHPKGQSVKISNIISIIKNSEFVISNRYHAFLFALANKIPTINLLKKISGDKRYYYNKSYGLLKEIFKGLELDLFDYLVEDFTLLLRKFKNEYKDLLIAQRERYSSPKYKNNLEKHYRYRKNYLKKNISNSITF